MLKPVLPGPLLATPLIAYRNLTSLRDNSPFTAFCRTKVPGMEKSAMKQV